MSQLANLWEETAIPAPACPPLDGSVRTDVLVVGAGYLGLSAALHLAERGIDVRVLEAERIGFGASGRNGGQLIPGLKYDPDELEAMYGEEAGARLWRFAGGSADFVAALIGRHGIDAGLRRSAWVQGVHSEKAAARARTRAEQWRRRGADVAYLGRAETAAIVGADLYVGAFVDRRAGALQPLSYARGLAGAALAAGALIHERVEVTRLERSQRRWRAGTSTSATVEADSILLCTNAYAGPLLPALPRSIVAANSLQIATEPLPDRLRATILAGGEVLSDTRKVIRYWRLDAQGRLLMGGRGPFREPGPERDWSHLAREVVAIYPALKGIGFTHRWGGRVAIHPDYMPRLHRPGPGMLAAIGCQGRGIGWQSAMGAELARIVAEPAHLPVLPITPVKTIPFAPLKRAGVSATLASMRLADRLGLS